MLTSFFQALLPGLRDVRTPLVAGLLWVLLFWLLLADLIPDEAPPGFLRQALAYGAEAGSGVTLAAVGVLAYIIGILGVTLADVVQNVALTTFLKPLAWIRQHLEWQRRARQRASLAAGVRKGT